MKTASLGLLEVMVVRVNAGGDAPPDPPSVGDVRQGHLFCFLQEQFFGEENSFGGLRTDLAGLNSLNLYSRHV
jgi:hypothetical protein